MVVPVEDVQDSESGGHYNEGFSAEDKRNDPLPASRLYLQTPKKEDKVISEIIDLPSPGSVGKFPKAEKWRILKNVLVVSCAFMILYTAFQVRDFV